MGHALMGNVRDCCKAKAFCDITLSVLIFGKAAQDWDMALTLIAFRVRLLL